MSLLLINLISSRCLKKSFFMLAEITACASKRNSYNSAVSLSDNNEKINSMMVVVFLKNSISHSSFHFPQFNCFSPSYYFHRPTNVFYGQLFYTLRLHGVSSKSSNGHGTYQVVIGYNCFHQYHHCISAK
jgi:hypothetical protein